MNELWKTLRLAAYIVALPLVATAAVSAYQWTSPGDQSVNGNNVSATISTVVSVGRSHSIMLDKNNQLNGRIWSTDSDYKSHFNPPNMTVMLYRAGKVVAQTTTDENGQFALSNVKPGIYSFVARGKDQFSTYAIRVESNDGSDAKSIFESITVMNRLTRISQAISSKTKPAESATVNDRVDLSIRSGNRIELDEQNNLVGSLVATIKTSDLSANSVSLMRNGETIAEAKPAADGSFVFPNVQPGFYDFVTTGQNGAAAIGLEAVKPSGPIRKASFNHTLQELPQTFDVPLIDPNDVGPIFQNLFPGNFFGPGFGGPGLGGPGGFGGPGGVGLPGFGGGARILGVAGFGLGLGALIKDNNPPPASPTN